MSLTKEETSQLVKTYRVHDSDTASPQVQVAVLTAQLNQLNNHFKVHTKDHHSRRSLMKMVGRRRKLLTYLRNHNASAYKKLIADLGLRK